MTKLTKLNVLTEEAEKGLNGSMDNDRIYFINAIMRDECELWKVNDDSYMITRLEITETKEKLLVICCYGGRGIWETFDYLRGMCKQNGYKGIRFHTHMDEDKMFKICPKEIDISDVKEIERVYAWECDK